MLQTPQKTITADRTVLTTAAKVKGVLVCIMLAGLLQACGTATDELPAIDVSGLDQTQAGFCDNLVPTHCLYPFPNNFFTVSDPATPTGLRINFNVSAMSVADPISVPPSQLAPTGVETTQQMPIDPSEWNRNDGFSPGSMLLAHLPGIDLQRTGATTIGDVSDAARGECFFPAHAVI